MSEKFVAYFRFIDTCAEAGCPICRCAIEAGRRFLDALIYEQVNDPENRRYLRASWGFCNWHTWMLREVADSAFGASIIYEDLLSCLVHRLDKLRDRTAGTPAKLRTWLARVMGVSRRPAVVELFRRRRPCRVCVEVAGAEERYLDTLLGFVGDLQFQRAYERSEGLCAPHTLLAIERGAGGAAIDELLRLTLPKWTAVRQDLQRFVNKHDYRNREPFTDEEAASYTRAFATVAGASRLFGNDLRVTARAPRRARWRICVRKTRAFEPSSRR